MTKSILFFLCLSTSLFLNPVAEDWELTTEKEGIQVFTRFSETSNFKEVRIKLTIANDMNKLIAFLNDVPKYKSWVYKCIAAEELGREDAQNYTYYVETDMPFPLQNRDLVVKSKSWKDPVTGIVMSKSVAAQDVMPKKNGIVRIPAYESSWRIEPLGPNKTFIDYKVKTDPGGSLPAWIVNMGVTIGPVKTMQALRKELDQYASN